VKSGKYEKQNMRLKSASYKSAVASGLFFHKEQMYKTDQDGDGYLEQLNDDDYGKRTLYHAAGGLMNLAFPISLLGIMGGSAITKMRALATRSTERTLSSDRNASYGAPLANFRNALETVEGMAIGNGPLLASCKQVRRSLEAFLKKRNAQHEGVTRNQNGTIAENVSSNWMTKNLLKGVFNTKAYGPK
jgi:hypothetical protein